MLYLILEILIYLGVAALIGFVIGWGLFGGKKSKGDPKSAAALKAAEEAKKKAESRIKELEVTAEGLQSNLYERDARLDELQHQLDQAAKYRIEAASQAEQFQERIDKQEASLRKADAERANLMSGLDGDTANLVKNLQSELDERDERLKVLSDQLDEHKGKTPDTRTERELREKITELRATLESGADGDASAAIASLKEEITGLRAAYEAAERSLEDQERALEEQDGAIDQLTAALADAQRRIAEATGEEAPAMPAPVAVPTAAPSIRETMIGSPPLKRVTDTHEEEGVPAETVKSPFDMDDEPEEQDEATVAMPVFDLADEVELTPAPSVEDAAEVPPLPADAAEFTPAPGSVTEDEPEEQDEATMAMPVFELPGEDPPAPAAPVADISKTVQDTPAAPSFDLGGDDPEEQDEATMAMPAFDLPGDDPPTAVIAEVVEAPPAPAVEDDDPEEQDEATMAMPAFDLPGDDPPGPPSPPPVAAADEDDEPEDQDEATMAMPAFDLPAADDDDSGDDTTAVSAAELFAAAGQEPPSQPPADDNTPPPRQKNDLKEIKGIGPAMEKRLNEAGIFSWSQLAALKTNDIDALADEIKVSADKVPDWIDAAKSLTSA